MRTIVKGKNVEVPERVRDYTERKLRRLERLLDDRTDAIVEFSNEMHKSASDAHIAEVTLVIDGRTLRSHAVGISYQAALDEVVDKVERQAVDHKSKPRLRARPEEEKRILQSLADGTREPGHERRIVKTKRFAIEPMFEEDAATSMEELGHKFFVFVNAETERIAILYARDDGDLGMIEPVVGGDYTTGRQHGNGREGADRTNGRSGTGRR
jgi:putative sigma-54 modulation protein